MFKELIQIQDRFQPLLRDQDYSFIGPEDQGLLEAFMRRANELAPVVDISRELRHFLDNKETAIQALDVLPADTKLRIYVVSGRVDEMLFHHTIENYCKEHNIDFKL